jgi:cephalosporin-C deacetylase-like acetyl esterase
MLKSENQVPSMHFPMARAFLAGLTMTVAAAFGDGLFAADSRGQERTPAGNEMIHDYLAQETAKIEAKLDNDFSSLTDWQAQRPKYLEEYFYMLGLSPMPERTPLKPVITRTIKCDGYEVDMLHFQSRPRLYVTANLYRPANVIAGEKLPAVLYLCGHSSRGRDGNKTAYQSHGIWFARHGYVCLVLDTLQLGEIGSYHHGTYNLGRWWWHSRGYTPAGVEAWNGIRAIDYLISRPDVDAERIAVTGISGGGATTFWVAAADERVKVAVPVSGMSDLHAYVDDELIDRHCDCMFLYNSYQWPWTRIAALVAPRPLSFVNSDHDDIFPMPANERIAARLERAYKLYGAGDQVDAVTSIGGHDYRKDIRQAAFRFINTHLKNDPGLIIDSEEDAGTRDPATWTLRGDELRVFPTDADLPGDELNTAIDQSFVPLGEPAPPSADSFQAWRTKLIKELRTHSFSYFPDTIPPAVKLREQNNAWRMRSEDSIEFRLGESKPPALDGKHVLLVVLNQDDASEEADWVESVIKPGEVLFFCEPRGIGATRWTPKKGGNPNYVERAHALLGRTVDAGRVWDIIAAAAYLQQSRQAEVRVAGRGAAAVLTAYAAALDERIGGAAVVHPPLSHMDQGAPQLLNALRICDVPDVLGLIAPRPLDIQQAEAAKLKHVKQAYDAAGASSRLSIK